MPGKTTIAAHVDHVLFGLSILNRWAAGEANPWAGADWNASWQRTTVTDDQRRTLRDGLCREAEKWRKVVATRTSWDDMGAVAALSTAAHTAYNFGAGKSLRCRSPASRSRAEAIAVFYRSGEDEMEIRKTLHATSREEWRAWLTKHYQSEIEVWLIYYKKHTGRPRISYDQAIEEALCFGWIDSIVKRMDDEKFAQKFTPRRDSTRWSALNKRRLRKLIREGRMTEAGLAKIDLVMLGEEARAKQRTGEEDIPGFVKQALMANAKAWENFRSLTPSRRRAYHSGPRCG